MDQLLSLRVFASVAQEGSFVKAAERLQISPPMVSKHIARLEERLGARLFHRNTRKVALSDLGRVYWESVKAILDDLDEAELAVSHGSQRASGRLSVTAPTWFSSPFFARILATFQQAYPQVELDLDLRDRLVDIVEEGYDLALRVGRDEPPSLLSRRLGDIQFLLVAAPTLVGKPMRHFSSLQGYPWLDYAYVEDSGRLIQGEESVQLRPVLRSNSTSLLRDAAVAGMGLALLPHPLVREDLQARRLQVVLPQLSWPTLGLYGVYSSRRFLSTRVQVFLQHLQTATISQAL